MSKLITTEDGSHTLYSDRFNEHYHSIHGAIQESLHVFIEAGLKECPLHEINILEVGFGTGLNALLTYLYAKENNLSIRYTSLELYPLSIEQIKGINYPLLLDSDDEFIQMHKAVWGHWGSIAPAFELKKMHTDLTLVKLDDQYDVIFFDAFSPDIQPELWEEVIFSKIASHCSPKAILTTYSAKGAVRRALQAATFEVERIPGPHGKREMLRARLP